MNALTEPQLRALKEVAAGRVRATEGYRLVWPAKVRPDVLRRLRDQGLITERGLVGLTERGEMRLAAGS